MRATLAFLLTCGWCLSAGAPASAEIGFYGWGPRLGVGDDPDQILIGLTQDLGEFVKNLRFQPSLDLGLGDDYTVVSVVVPVHYRFSPGAGATPYLGGGILVAWIDRDLTQGQRRRGVDESEIELAPLLAGGVEWSVGRNSDVLLELQVPAGEVHDAKLLLGWIFRAR